jgi:hypothetical protein
MACGGSTSGPRACCGPPDTVTPVTDDTLPPDVAPDAGLEDESWTEDLPEDPEAEWETDIVGDDNYDGHYDVVETDPATDTDTDFDGIPDSEDIDVYEDSDMDGIPNDQDYSADNPILDNHDNNMDATNVWTDDGSGW